MSTSPELRRQLLSLLDTGNAHMSFDEAVAGFPLDRINDRAPNVPYTPWQLLEHIRITQRDILNYLQDDPYDQPRWPEGYWPRRDLDAGEEEWNDTIRRYREDRASLEKIVADETQDLDATVPTNEEHSILREIITVASHTHYHLGEFAILRQVMGTWGPDHET